MPRHTRAAYSWASASGAVTTGVLRWLVIALMSCLSHPALSQPEGLSAERITTRNGAAVLQYTAIRFAQAPAGRWRWRPPRPVTQHEQRKGWPPACVQDDRTSNWYAMVATGVDGDTSKVPQTPAVSEDCLFLNVWTPTQKSPTKRPVMVWIYGGSNRSGWSYEPDYRGQELAASGVVVVSIAYRVGLFGFLAHPELSAESPHGSSGNYGLLDQIEALRWINKHIASLGGDPGNVTIFGESAGAGNIGYLLATPLADGLFHKAILQSGGWAITQQRALADDEKEGLEFSKRTGMSIEQLRQVSATDMLRLQQQDYERGYDDPPIDGWLLPRAPAELMQRKDLPTRPVLLGSNADESLMYLNRPSLKDWQQALATYAAPDRAWLQQRFSALPIAQRLNQLASAVSFHCPTLATAEALHQAGSSAYVYRFDRIRDNAQRIGAYHGAEIPYVFGTHADWLFTNEKDWALTEKMMDMWLSFAESGAPAQPQHWPTWDSNACGVSLNTQTTRVRLDTQLCKRLGFNLKATTAVAGASNTCQQSTTAIR
ncbi:MAG: carboxylesterase family protein [Proteobacteria bacterium]|nr:carboxylesterase family protein [Pseudomonadota bacterium]